MRIELKTGPEVKDLVDPFYERAGGGARARNEDLFFLAYKENQVVGSVRFCVEENTPMLRSMMIREDCRAQGIGSELLKVFAEFLDQNKISNVFCIPYEYLEKFYGAECFRKAKEEEIPPFLVKRLAEYNLKPKKFICMVRSESKN